MVDGCIEFIIETPQISQPNRVNPFVKNDLRVPSNQRSAFTAGGNVTLICIIPLATLSLWSLRQRGDTHSSPIAICGQWPLVSPSQPQAAGNGYPLVPGTGGRPPQLFSGGETYAWLPNLIALEYE